MATQDLTRLSIAQVSELIRSSQISPLDLVETTMARIAELDGTINSYITVMEDQARRSAQEAERQIKAGEYLGPLHGVPIGLKDIINTKDVLTTNGSKVDANHVPDHDATVTQRLAREGAVIIGKHGCYEYACSPPNPLYGPSRNPWDTTRDTGGSSSGTGAAIAAFLCYGGIGTDTGGSIRNPAGICGIVGLKQTYGRASRRGYSHCAGHWTMPVPWPGPSRTVPSFCRRSLATTPAIQPPWTCRSPTIAAPSRVMYGVCGRAYRAITSSTVSNRRWSSRSGRRLVPWKVLV